MATPGHAYQYGVGLQNVGSYQVSGKPWVSGGIDLSNGTVSLSFPDVTGWIMVSNATADSCKIGFSAFGVGGTETGQGTNYFTVPANSTTERLYVKVTELHLTGASTSVDVMAGLTYINSAEINNNILSPDGTNWSGSSGVLVG